MSGGLLALGVVACVWLSSRIVRLNPGERLARHPLAAVLLVGIVWWLCLTPGVLGFLLAVGVVLFAAGRLFWRQPEVAGNLVDLGFVQMGDWLNVGSPVA